MLRLRNKKTGRISLFVSRIEDKFSELVEAIQQLKELHNTDTIYVYMGSNNYEHTFSGSEFHTLSQHARLIRTREIRGRAYHYTANHKCVSLFLGIDNNEKLFRLTSEESIFYTFIIWDTYVEILTKTKAMLQNIDINTCNYMNIYGEIYK